MKSMSIILSLIVISASLAYGKVPPRESRAACEGETGKQSLLVYQPQGTGERHLRIYTGPEVFCLPA